MEWDPEDYAKNSGAQLAWARELIDRLQLRGDETLLDVGCGDGKVTAELAGAVPRGFVLGVDGSPAFVAYARRHFPAESHANLAFEQMDARALACDRAFDAIFSNAALHWVDDHRAFLAGSARLLKRGGRLVLSCGGAGNAGGIVAAMKQVTDMQEWAASFTDFAFPYFFYSTSDYERWLPEAGFRPARLELVRKDMIHDGRAGLAGWIRTTWLPYTQRLPENQREAFVLACVDAYLREHPLDDAGRTHVSMVRLEVDAYRQ